MWQCENVRMWGRDNMTMWEYQDVKMWICDNVRKNVTMWKYENQQLSVSAFGGVNYFCCIRVLCIICTCPYTSFPNKFVLFLRIVLGVCGGVYGHGEARPDLGGEKWLQRRHRGHPGQRRVHPTAGEGVACLLVTSSVSVGFSLVTSVVGFFFVFFYVLCFVLICLVFYFFYFVVWFSLV